MDNQNSYQQSPEQQPGYMPFIQGGQQVYQQQLPVMGNPYEMWSNAPLPMNEWLGTIFLLFIPFINIIMLFVWAFGKSNLNKKNFAKAGLIIFAVILVLSIVFNIIGRSIFSRIIAA